MTIQSFIAYLESMNLDHSNVVDTEQEFIATVFWEPRLRNFTQVLRNTNGTWLVRLAKVDLQTEAITGGFFN